MPSPRRRLRVDPSRGATLRAGFARIRQEHDLPLGFPAPVAAEADRVSGRATQDDRRDLRDVPFLTLDPPGSTDLDQAMHLSRRGSGYLVRYAIADVAHFVVPGGPIDREARTRASTVYCPDTRVPLHPELLSEGVASLLVDQVRPAIVWSIALDPEGRTTDVEVERAVVRSRAQLTYPATQRALDEGRAGEVIDLLAEIGTLRARLEESRGGVSLARPEQEVVPVDDHWELSLASALPIEEHNAQISLLTGMAGAALMLELGTGLLRTMPAAQARDLARLRRQGLALGVDWPQDEPYGAVLRRLDRSLPSTAAFLAAATTLFRGAAWTAFDGTRPDDPVHGAVGAPYAHVTAPLRRLVDRYGLEIALAAHAGRPVPEWVLAALPDVGGEMATGAARASSVDRACTDLVEATVLAPHIGEDFDAVVLDDRTVQVSGPAVVGRLTDGSGLAGQRIRVRLIEADPSAGRVRFSPVDAAAPGSGPSVPQAP
ncbi:RNB domain-containing ribonuclease [Actinotalea sp.]|uniref:RNB domain-containing ribonuclease n=1 Tax=Actinotalea sp. TaxID=1872145 RepID=UPI003564D282